MNRRNFLLSLASGIAAMARQQIVGFRSMDDFQRVAKATRGYETSQADRTLGRANDSGGDDYDAIGVKNGEATDCPPFGIMLTNGSIAKDSWFVDIGKRPDVYGCQYNFLIATQDGVKAGKFGGAQSGIGNRYVVAYDSSDGTPAAGENWGPRSGTFLAKKNTGGFVVVKVVDSTKFWVLVRAEPMIAVNGTIASDLAPDASGTLTVFTGAPGSETTTSQTISSVRNSSDCTLKSGSGAKIHSAMYFPSDPGWRFVIGRTV